MRQNCIIGCIIIFIFILSFLLNNSNKHYGSSDTSHRDMLNDIKNTYLNDDWKPHPLFKPLENIETFASNFGYKNIEDIQNTYNITKNIDNEYKFLDKSLGSNKLEEFSSDAFHRQEMHHQNIEKKFSQSVLKGDVPGLNINTNLIEGFAYGDANLHKDGYYGLTKTYPEKNNSCNKYMKFINNQPMFNKPQVK